ncbi:hypothetical protein [Kitasatospora sp. NPDC087315]|uniref:hypothetical protein n=1 Tax=Kitasatospora sp. NPDC087315 TaxID=3364069 RepID=UPI0037F54411
MPRRSFDGTDRVGQGTGRPRPLSRAGSCRRVPLVVVRLIGDGLRAHRQVQSPEQQDLFKTDEQQAAAVGMKEVRIDAYFFNRVHQVQERSDLCQARGELVVGDDPFDVDVALATRRK